MSNNKNDLPNDWTYCTLTISTFRGDSEDFSELERLKQELIDPDDECPLSFFQHAPIPQCLIESCYKCGDAIEKDNEDECGYRYLHEFTKKEWGTPFDADSVILAEGFEDNTLEYTFRTLDGFPSAWLQDLSVDFPHLIFDLDCVNEIELIDSFSMTFLDGDEIDHRFHKKQP